MVWCHKARCGFGALKREDSFNFFQVSRVCCGWPSANAACRLRFAVWHSFVWHELVHCPHAVAATFRAQLLCKILVQTKTFYLVTLSCVLTVLCCFSLLFA